jgi:hypothetical protein
MRHALRQLRSGATRQRCQCLLETLGEGGRGRVRWSIVLVHEATCDGGIPLGITNPGGARLCSSTRMDEDQRSSSGGSDATMRRASSMLKPRTEPSLRSPERFWISSAHAAWIATSVSFS